MAVNWALALPQGNLGEQVNQAFQQGQQQYTQNAARNALGTLVQNPNDPRALAALAKVSPETAMQFRQQQAELLKQQLAQHQDNIVKGAEIMRQFQPKDQQGYSQALAAAQAAGIDLTGVPQVFNQQYVDGIVHLADALKPQPQGDPNQVVVTPQPGTPAFIYDKRSGQTREIFAPNPGDQTAGAPVGAPTATDAHGNKVQFNAQTNQWEPIGGQTAPQSGGFLGAGSYPDVGPYHRY